MRYFKVEIVIAESFLQDIIAQLEDLDVTGFSTIEISRGKGTGQGYQRSEGLLPVTRNSLVFTIAPEEQITAILERLEDFVESHGGLVATYRADRVVGLSSYGHVQEP